VLAAVLSSFPSPALRATRVIGVVTGFAAAGLSFLALQVSDGHSYLDRPKDARIGFYLAVIGFVLVGIGAAMGPWQGLGAHGGGDRQGMLVVGATVNPC